MTQHDGGPAFPRPATQYVPQPTSMGAGGYYSSGWGGTGVVGDAGHPGMSLRDYLAAKAMAGLLASGQHPGSSIPSMAYDLADAMLKAREGKP